MQIGVIIHGRSPSHFCAWWFVTRSDRRPVSNSSRHTGSEAGTSLGESHADPLRACANSTVGSQPRGYATAGTLRLRELGNRHGHPVLARPSPLGRRGPLRENILARCHGSRCRQRSSDSSLLPRCVAEMSLDYDQERRRWRAPSPGSALGAPARHGRADTGQQPQINSAHSQAASATGGHFPRLPLSSSQAPPLGRPTGVATRWLRQPRPGTCSQGFGAARTMGDEWA